MKKEARHDVMVFCVTFILFGFQSITQGREFVHPSPDNGGYYTWLTLVKQEGGTVKMHLGHDYNAPVDTEVKSITKGEVFRIQYVSSGCYSKEGALQNQHFVWIKHQLNNDRYFYALYGHIDPYKDIQKDASVSVAQPIGEIVDCYVWYEGKLVSASHLHFGIWNSGDDPPTDQLGYVPQGESVGEFVDPVCFLATANPKFAAQEEVVTTANLKVRKDAGLNYEEIKPHKPAGTFGKIQEGPVCQDNYVWWKVRYQDSVLGWSVENWLAADSEIPAAQPVESVIPGLAIAVVMDRSGSMTGEKLAKAQRAAGSFFASLSPEDFAAFITFADQGTTQTSLLQTTSQNKARLEAGVSQVTAGGSTNIGDGLNHGLQQLQKAKTAVRKAALLLSDGMHNTGELWPSVDAFQQKGWPVYTVAYGSDADQATLAEIARRTGGNFSPSGLTNLTQVYHKINAQMNNRSVLFSYNDLIKQGQSINYKVPIDPDIDSAVFFADWQGSQVELYLTSPQGRQITPQAQEIVYQQGPTYCFYEIPNPQAGSWQARLVGQNIAQPQQVNFTVSGLSPFQTNILGFQPEYARGQTINISVKVARFLEGETEPLRNIKVTAQIKKPPLNPKPMVKSRKVDWKSLLRQAITRVKKTKLQDSGDGIFTGTYKHADINGVYLVTVNIEAQTSKGQTITRTLRESVQVGPIEDRQITLEDILGDLPKLRDFPRLR